MLQTLYTLFGHRFSSFMAFVVIAFVGGPMALVIPGHTNAVAGVSRPALLHQCLGRYPPADPSHLRRS
jgi:hypothetical protein